MDITLSALQHYAFCPRQCALIYVEQIWQENEHTALGRLMHETAHSGISRMRDGVKVATDLELHSARLGLHGRADIVEFRREGKAWKPCPVEYKKGNGRCHRDADAAQLCGQALCLEEMLGVEISEGALYYGQTRKRHVIEFGQEIRGRVEEMVLAIRELLESGITPRARKKAWCDSCSLNSWCMPRFTRTASVYVQRLCQCGDVE